MRRLFLLTLTGLLVSNGLAQTVSLEELLRKVETVQKTTKDFTFRIQGQASIESTTQKIDLKVFAIPSLNLTRIEFNAPDALADNILIVDKKTASNYLFLTNQVTINTLDKTKVEGFNFDFARFTDFSTNLSKDTFFFKLISTPSTKEGKVYVIEAIPKNPEGGPGKTRIWISDGDWRPIKVQTLDNAGKIQADLAFLEWKSNTGLKDKDLRKLPKGAQVIKK